jgi:hypothetical protein
VATRRVLTRDLLLRARAARPAERHALEFRTLHLNLPLIADVATRLGLDDAQRSAVEHHAIEGLLEAVRIAEPDGAESFAVTAGRLIEQRVVQHLPPAAGPERVLPERVQRVQPERVQRRRGWVDTPSGSPYAGWPSRSRVRTGRTARPESTVRRVPPEVRLRVSPRTASAAPR